MQQALRTKQTGTQADDQTPNRRTIIPTPRNNPLFSGWGVRF